LDSIKENGTVYVLLENDMARSTTDTPDDRPRSTDGTAADTPDAHAELVAAKDETINLLRSQLEAEREANRENRRIIAGLVQRVPELEAPRNGHETATAEPDREEEHRPATDGAQEAAEPRSWWRRWFGG
jgi:hypothetical protein